MQRVENSIPAGRGLMERVFELMPIIIGISKSDMSRDRRFCYHRTSYLMS